MFWSRFDWSAIQLRPNPFEFPNSRHCKALISSAARDSAIREYLRAASTEELGDGHSRHCLLWNGALPAGLLFLVLHFSRPRVKRRAAQQTPDPLLHDLPSLTASHASMPSTTSNGLNAERGVFLRAESDGRPMCGWKSYSREMCLDAVHAVEFTLLWLSYNAIARDLVWEATPTQVLHWALIGSLAVLLGRLAKRFLPCRRRVARRIRNALLPAVLLVIHPYFLYLLRPVNNVLE